MFQSQCLLASWARAHANTYNQYQQTQHTLYVIMLIFLMVMFEWKRLHIYNIYVWHSICVLDGYCFVMIVHLEYLKQLLFQYKFYFMKRFVCEQIFNMAINSQENIYWYYSIKVNHASQLIIYDIIIYCKMKMKMEILIKILININENQDDKMMRFKIDIHQYCCCYLCRIVSVILVDYFYLIFIFEAMFDNYVSFLRVLFGFHQF